MPNAEIPATPASPSEDIAPVIIGKSAAIRSLLRDISKVAKSSRPVLVSGETGTGKELVVHRIHALSRHPAPMLDLNCGALPELLFESQLFGHEKGAFTGAHSKSDGFLLGVGTGTLFLDEIGELALPVQAKLLRALESGEFRPIGSLVSRRFLGRIVAATHVDLEERVQRNQFREDLWYRLNVLELRVPPLRERREDIPALVAHFVQLAGSRLSFTVDAIEMLQAAAWPGNVRELRNCIDRLSVFLEDGLVTSDLLKERVHSRSKPAPFPTPMHDAPENEERRLSAFARALLLHGSGNKLYLAQATLLQEAIRMSLGNKAAAARLLGVHRKIVERKLRSFVQSASLTPASAGDRFPGRLGGAS
jgi:DNA-binding NtrC family response regulator